MKTKANRTLAYTGATFFGAFLPWGLWWMPGCFRGNAHYRLEEGALVVDREARQNDTVVETRSYPLDSVRRIVLFDTQDTWCCRILFAEGGWVDIVSLIRQRPGWSWEEAYPAFFGFVSTLHQVLAERGVAVDCRRGSAVMRVVGGLSLAAGLIGGAQMVIPRLSVSLVEFSAGITEGISWASIAVALALGFRLTRVGGIGQPALGSYALTTPPLKQPPA